MVNFSLLAVVHDMVKDHKKKNNKWWIYLSNRYQNKSQKLLPNHVVPETIWHANLWNNIWFYYSSCLSQKSPELTEDLIRHTWLKNVTQKNLAVCFSFWLILSLKSLVTSPGSPAFSENSDSVMVLPNHKYRYILLLDHPY